MPIQMPQWTEYLSCPICCNMFDEAFYRPISLACGHTICKCCLGKLKQKRCPFDQNVINRDIDELPVNLALLQLVGVAVPETQEVSADKLAHNTFYVSSKKCIEDLAIYLKPLTTGECKHLVKITILDLLFITVVWRIYCLLVSVVFVAIDIN